jgi:hypothetical protein
MAAQRLPSTGRLEPILRFSRGPSTRRHAGLAALAAAAATLALAQGSVTPAAASTVARVALPDPTPLGTLAGTPAALASAPELTLRVYLAGRPEMAAAALAVSSPSSPRYGHYLSTARFRRQYGPDAAQARTVANWLTSQGMTVTATTQHYIAVDATVAETDAAFGTKLIQYDFPPITIRGLKIPVAPQIGTSGGFSVPAALGHDIATVTGLGLTNLPVSSSSAAATSAAPATASTSSSGGYQCSQYWGLTAWMRSTMPAFSRSDSTTWNPAAWTRGSWRRVKCSPAARTVTCSTSHWAA